MLIAGGFLTVIWLVTGSSMASTFGTPEARREVVSLSVSLPPIILGLYGGTQENLATLGGFANWRFGFIFFMVPAVWSLLALSSTLVSEARRGSMDMIAATPLSRRSIALQKVGAHFVAMSLVMVLFGLAGWVVGTNFATLTPDEVAALGGHGTDEISLGATMSYALTLGIMALAAGSIAFAAAPFAGRSAGAGVAAAVLVGSWIVYGYRESVPLFGALEPLSWFSWTAGQRPIAGTYDWLSLLPMALIVIGGVVIGVIAFERRDIGAIGSIKTPRLPDSLRGVGGPFGRTLSDRIAGILSWGAGIGLLGVLFASSAEQLRESILGQPSLQRMFETAYPSIDLNAPGMILQLAFLTFGYLCVGFAAATALGGWASDETEGRLEMVLATSLGRARWFLQSATGVFAAILLVTVIVAAGIGFGVLVGGDDPATPMLGTAALTLYGAAIAGIGLAFAGWVRASVAMAASSTVVVANILLDILVPALRLPGWVHDFALTSHFGEPMVGSWDLLGVGICLSLAVGGLGIGAIGFARRDLPR
jgi:ABC-2 type transport system permease protein